MPLGNGSKIRTCAVSRSIPKSKENIGVSFVSSLGLLDRHLGIGINLTSLQKPWLIHPPKHVQEMARMERRLKRVGGWQISVSQHLRALKGNRELTAWPPMEDGAETGLCSNKGKNFLLVKASLP